MGKWSAYRRRGSSRPPPGPPPSVVLVENGSGVASFDNYLAAGGPTTRAPSPGWLAPHCVVTSVGFMLQRVLNPAGQVQGVIWSSGVGVPSLPRIVSSALISKMLVPLVGDWIDFPVADTEILAGTAVYPGLSGDIEITSDRIQTGYTPSGLTPQYYQSTAAELVWSGAGPTGLMWWRVSGYLL